MRIISQSSSLIIVFLLLGWEHKVDAQELKAVEPVAQRVETSSDTYQKLIVSGSSADVRHRVLSIAMDVREQVYKLIDLEEGSQVHPLVITLHGALGETPPMRLTRKGFSLLAGSVNLTLEVHLAKGVNERQLEQELTELMLYELGMREHKFKQDDTLELKLHPWISSGVHEAILWKTQKGDRHLYARLFQDQAIYPIKELLEEDEFDTGHEMLNHSFDLSSGVMVLALLNQPQGKQGFYALLKEASTYEGEQMILISKHFPDTTLSQNSLSKWWTLQLAAMSKKPAEELLSISETHEALEEILPVVLIDLKGGQYIYDPINYMDIKQHSELVRIQAVTLVINKLEQLQTRAFPSYRSIIGGYQQALLRVTELKRKNPIWRFFSKEEAKDMGTTQMVIKLEQERKILAKLGGRTTDYLNWITLEMSDAETGEFQDYLDLKNELETASSSDGGYISKYLDDIEKLYDEE